ncbi:hypothetical protein BATDEDRAFT_89255 [Batrachochytrium dendrobatidis JAM81]|uniref:BZIP domain-containing protein n=1 Tax=Batrachochytrium dendrobatidis (strain JAM81 / FGSC 10211) TaxID=684364 RepID=F4P504_BATDJ|nr:uncharacterized protein BATDEDRAFT_89255 [Batrachochytrium dendrobatidis JAM81]EGF80014.1 hypothetical protein BATDEDRAFT_89255 [Batrachochytrium dendrobatidis JAM81]|eukprot:XP_006679756.1 hypothetical protein BATDEDRAFT_89255 [Batrachochytrium dendrobatidis JAM81]
MQFDHSRGNQRFAKHTGSSKLHQSKTNTNRHSSIDTPSSNGGAGVHIEMTGSVGVQVTEPHMTHAMHHSISTTQASLQSFVAFPGTYAEMELLDAVVDSPQSIAKGLQVIRDVTQIQSTHNFSDPATLVNQTQSSNTSGSLGTKDLFDSLYTGHHLHRVGLSPVSAELPADHSQQLVPMNLFDGSHTPPSCQQSTQSLVQKQSSFSTPIFSSCPLWEPQISFESLLVHPLPEVHPTWSTLSPQDSSLLFEPLAQPILPYSPTSVCSTPIMPVDAMSIIPILANKSTKPKTILSTLVEPITNIPIKALQFKSNYQDTLPILCNQEPLAIDPFDLSSPVDVLQHSLCAPALQIPDYLSAYISDPESSTIALDITHETISQSPIPNPIISGISERSLRFQHKQLDFPSEQLAKPAAELSPNSPISSNIADQEIKRSQLHELTSSRHYHSISKMELTDADLKRARNRVAARRSRERKNSRIIELEHINQTLVDELEQMRRVFETTRRKNSSTSGGHGNAANRKHDQGNDKTNGHGRTNGNSKVVGDDRAA